MLTSFWRRENSAEGSEAIRNLGFSLVESENLEASMVFERLKRGCGQVWPEDATFWSLLTHCFINWICLPCVTSVLSPFYRQRNKDQDDFFPWVKTFHFVMSENVKITKYLSLCFRVSIYNFLGMSCEYILGFSFHHCWFCEAYCAQWGKSFAVPSEIHAGFCLDARACSHPAVSALCSF